MAELTKLREAIGGDNAHKIPEDWQWHCEECEWKGLVQDCETEREPVGFVEGPWYDQPICPNCGAGVTP